MKVKFVLASQSAINEIESHIRVWANEYDLLETFPSNLVGESILEWELNKRGLTSHINRATYTNQLTSKS